MGRVHSVVLKLMRSGLLGPRGVLDVLQILLVEATFINTYFALLQRIFDRRKQLRATMLSDIGSSAAAAMWLPLMDGWSYRSVAWWDRGRHAYAPRHCLAKPDMTISTV